MDDAGPPTGITTLAVSGDIDMTNAANYIAQARSIIEDGKTRAFAIDLGGTEFIDSQGIGFLIESRNLALKKGIPITLESVPARVRKILQITGLAPVFALDA